MSGSAVATIALVAGGLGYLALACFVWANRQGVGSRPLIVMLMAVKIWSVCYALELSSRSLGTAQFWSGLKYVGIVALPPALWSFVFAYTGRGRLSQRTLGLLLIHPVVVLALLATPGTRDLLQNYDQPEVLLGAPVPGAAPPLFWVHAVYVYVLMLSADFVLLSRLARIARPYRRQGALLVAASILPFVGNAAYNARAFGDDVVDPTPFLFGVTGVVLVWGFFRLKLLDLTPVARGIVIEQMADGVLVLDVYGRVADVNTAATSIVGHPRRAMVGRPATDLVPGLAPLLRRGDVARRGTIEDELRIQPLPADAGETSIGALPAGRGRRGSATAVLEATRRTLTRPRDPEAADGQVLGPPRDVAVSLTWVTDQVGRQIARLVVLRDVTDRKRTERRLRDLLDEQTRLSETLRQTLRPSSLPQIDGVRLAARSVPSVRAEGVGGDFYDVHPAGDEVSAFVLGDVSGKGVHAAVVTSMARYTVRTLSAQGWAPQEVLQQLNRALLTSDDLERFCTVVYGQVRPAGSPDPAAHPVGPLLTGPLPVLPPGSTSSGVRLVLALGGHPPPLLRRRDRSVQAVGQPGTVLGLLPTVDVHEVTIDMSAGDVLLAYTDGVTEARSGDEQFGEERLAGVLAGVPDDFGESPTGPYPAGQLANAVADAVLRAVRVFAPERDDVALLVLAAT